MKNDNFIYNNPIELATRSSLILFALESDFSLDDLLLLDYAMLYTKEFGGPPNLHPATPNHIAEIASRREPLFEALQYFVKKGLINFSFKETGYYYSANINTGNFISCLSSAYYKKAWIRIDWLEKNYQNVLNNSFPKYRSANT